MPDGPRSRTLGCSTSGGGVAPLPHAHLHLAALARRAVSSRTAPRSASLHPSPRRSRTEEAHLGVGRGGLDGKRGGAAALLRGPFCCGLTGEGGASCCFSGNRVASCLQYARVPEGQSGPPLTQRRRSASELACAAMGGRSPARTRVPSPLADTPARGRAISAAWVSTRRTGPPEKSAAISRGSGLPALTRHSPRRAAARRVACEHGPRCRCG